MYTDSCSQQTTELQFATSAEWQIVTRVYTKTVHDQNGA